jgi:hypothetical protein
MENEAMSVEDGFAAQERPVSDQEADERLLGQ